MDLYLPTAETVSVGGGVTGVLLLILIILAIIYFLRRA
jgi:hypothetical protein